MYNHYKRIHHARELSAAQLAQEAAAARAAESGGADIRGGSADEVELDKSNVLLLGPTGSGKARSGALLSLSPLRVAGFT